jgi:hypothetical protein
MRLQTHKKPKKREFKARLWGGTHIVLVESRHPMIHQLAPMMLPVGAMTVSTYLWAYRTNSFQPPIVYNDVDGTPLVSMRSISEQSDEWKKIREIAASA